MSEPVYKVVWPLGKSTVQSVSMKRRIDGLAGKTIGELSHGGFRDQEIRPILEETLSNQYAGIKFIDHSVFGSIHGLDGAKNLAAVPEKLRELGCDAVIVGIGS
jgi:hypothetical protein